MPGRLMCSLLALDLVVGVGSVMGQRADTLPTTIATAFHQAYPGAKILNVSRERRDGKVVYEIESQDGAARRDLIYDLEGHALEIEDIIPADSVPAAVRAAVERDMKGATLVGAERVTTGTVVVYEVQARKGGRSRFLTYDPNGVRKE